MSELFLPLDRLLCSGGDPRLKIDPLSGLNEYGCRPSPCPDTLSFASSTATSISERAFDRAANAREQLMRSASAIGIDAAFEVRLEAMRDELKTVLGLSRTGVDVVFSTSGTDAQLQALFLTRVLIGPALTTVVVAADQTGSGTTNTARGLHFNVATANGHPVRKGEPVAGLARSVTSIAIPLFDEAGDGRPQADSDALVIAAVESSVMNGRNVLLQVMDASKLGWRAPGERCLEEIAMRWPGRVQVVVDACQMRLGRPRLRHYLERGYMVIVTGSKFFTGPAFSGALLVPARLAPALDAASEVAPGLCEYTSRSDWPEGWRNLRSRFPVRTNFGQWLRWEAALEEIAAYYDVPDEFRRLALAMFGKEVECIIASSPSLQLLPRQKREADGIDDEELAEPTIFPFVIRRDGRTLSPEETRKIHRALSRDMGHAVAPDAAGDREIAATPCLIGQPVTLGATAVLRICAGARLVTQAWTSGADTAIGNLSRETCRIGAIAAKIEWLLGHAETSPRLFEPA